MIVRLIFLDSSSILSYSLVAATLTYTIYKNKITGSHSIIIISCSETHFLYFIGLIKSSSKEQCLNFTHELACLNIHHIYKQIKGNKHDPTTKLFFTIPNQNSSFFLQLYMIQSLKDVMQFVLYKINEDIFQVQNLYSFTH